MPSRLATVPLRLMYTIVAGTNREGSNTLKVAKEYQAFLKEEGIEASIFSLQEINMLHRDDDFMALEAEYLLSTQKFIFILPEYNGAFPGIFKLMIDMSDVKECWYGKKALLTGVATGRSGNLRGLDAMTNMCHYIKMHVLPNKCPISSIHEELENDRFTKEQTIETIKQQIKEFISF